MSQWVLLLSGSPKIINQSVPTSFFFLCKVLLCGIEEIKDPPLISHYMEEVAMLILTVVMKTWEGEIGWVQSVAGGFG